MKLADFNPTTLDEAIDVLYSNLDKKALKEFKEYGYVGFHHGFGTAIRNEWGLWKKGSALYNFFESTYGLTHADDMSGLILEGLESKCSGETYDPTPSVERYKKHWEKYS